jgi:hypothetical protein
MHLGHHSSQEFQQFSLVNNHNYNFNFKNVIPYSRKRLEIIETLIEKTSFSAWRCWGKCSPYQLTIEYVVARLVIVKYWEQSRPLPVSNIKHQIPFNLDCQLSGLRDVGDDLETIGL